MNDHFTQLVARHLSGEASPEERQELELILKEDPRAHYFYELFSNYWLVDAQKEMNPLQEEIHFQQILAIAEKDKADQPGEENFEPVKSRAKIISIKKILVAAALAGVILSSYFLFFQKKAHPQQVAVNEIEAKKGTRSFMQLPDGTKVWLNSDSKLEYNSEFSHNIREVMLIGEAYFDVVKEPAHPFIVHTSDIDIKVLGTAFNVKSYPKESFIETTLIHGTIEVRNNKQPESVLAVLHPNDKLVFHKPEPQPAAVNGLPPANKIFSINKVPPKIPDAERVETSWVYNKLVFDGETFREAAAKMERWYNVKIIFQNEQAANLQMHYRIENETIEEALKALQEGGFDFKYEINGNEIQIL